MHVSSPRPLKRWEGTQEACCHLFRVLGRAQRGCCSHVFMFSADIRQENNKLEVFLLPQTLFFSQATRWANQFFHSVWFQNTSATQISGLLQRSGIYLCIVSSAVSSYCGFGDLYTYWLLKSQFEEREVRLFAAELGCALGLYTQYTGRSYFLDWSPGWKIKV